MSHQLEQNETGTETAFFSARQTPWHQLGTVTTECLTAEDALRVAHLDWQVTKQPLQAHLTNMDGWDREDEHTCKGALITVPDKFATVRLNPFSGEPEVLGVVGRDYTVVQNDANAAFLNALVEESGAHFETAGSLRGGRQVFVSMKAPEGLLIGGVDAVDTYLVATNSHDGTKAWNISATPTRVVCANTLRMALAGAKASWSSRHTRNAGDRVAEAQEALGVMWDYSKHFKVEADMMADTAMVDAEFERIVSGLFVPAKGETDRQARDRAERIAAVQKVYHESPTQQAIYGTRWGGYNALTEYLDWHYPTKGDDTARAERVAVGGWLDKAKQDAYKAFAVK